MSLIPVPIMGLAPQRDRLVPKQSFEHVTNGQRCGKKMQLVGEGDDNWQFGCEPCGCAHVFSKPRARAAAQYRAQLERQAETQARRRQHDSRPKFFMLGGNHK